MLPVRKLLVRVAVVVLCASPLAAESVDALDVRLTNELRAIDPIAATLWTKANAARQAGKAEEAAGLYAEVHARVPSFDHALRRLAFEENTLGRRAPAPDHARAALAANHSAMNLSALGRILVEPKAAASDDEANEAKALTQEAVTLAPDDEAVYHARAEVAMATEDMVALRDAVTRLERLAPNDVQTHVFAFYASANEHEYAAARASLDRASTFGLAPESYTLMLGQLNSVTPFYVRWWKPVVTALAIWFGCFALLLGAGVILSRSALRAAREAPEDLSANATGLGARLRRVYGSVLFLSSVFYYVSVPVVIGLVLLVGGGLVYATFAIGHIPVKLVLITVVLVFVSIASIVKSLFVRVSDEDPGMRLDLQKHPSLRALLDEVAARIGTRAVDNVYLTPGTEVAVMERRKTKERCLILGVAGLDGLAIRPLKAVLGHEYGHFTNRDTAGGAFAVSVRTSVSATAYGLATGGAAAWYNPAWLFVNGFHRVFLRISEGASRLQEVLADRWAVFAYGADAFEAGLRHVVTRGVHFDAHVGATLKEVVDGQLPLTNLYTYQPAQPGDDVDAAIEQALQRQSSAYDSHPSPAERFALVHALPRQGTAPDVGDDAPAWTLFDDAAELQRAMTAQVRDNVKANYGIEIAGEGKGRGGGEYRNGRRCCGVTNYSYDAVF
jgi:Zn-dependent protease with chaperone function